ncbi:hypothetical protein JCGZ_18948 [Jatropha curcas]|uniref:Bet v I/Major latex protein domain-containing protein n=1 Tax=Jatropha curcas TaxID=180498 RepID=A0A067JYK4_JATCU|nr:major allergen Pru av 1 [Jatropha curcas]KDP27868.1 hypothetical protein JCGZ_18948 [Jatropha curcas]
MGFATYDMEISSPVPAAELFRAIVVDAETFLPKIFPQVIASHVTIEGDGGPGTIKQINSSDGKYVKERTDAIDREKFMYAYTAIEGEVLANTFEKISYEFSFGASPDGGSICKSSTKYYSISDTEIKKEEIEARKQNALAMFKVIEEYLLENPDAIN